MIDLSLTLMVVLAAAAAAYEVVLLVLDRQWAREQHRKAQVCHLAGDEGSLSVKHK